MTEYQKIAAGLLEMTHPEIVLHQRRVQAEQEAGARAPWPFVTRAQAAVGAFKFAVAAFVAGSRTVPMGDNGCVMHDLNAYGARQRMDANCP